jgi:hypothetical protein
VALDYPEPQQLPQAWGTKPLGSKSSGAAFPHGLQGTQFSGTSTRGTKPAGLGLLLPREQWEPCILFTHRYQFSWHFRVKVAVV